MGMLQFPQGYRGDLGVERPLEWATPSARKDMSEMPEPVKSEFGFALYQAQLGRTPLNAKPFHGVGSGVMELVERDDGNTYRAVYTVRFAKAVYVLHVFQKKSKQGIKTPQPDIDLIHDRLRDAERAYKEKYAR